MQKAETLENKLARFKKALAQLIERAAEDRTILAIILTGSLNEETIWQRESMGVWVIEADGVSRRLRSDGNDERIYRILVENEINIHAEVIPRSRFRQMVEGSSRTAFSCNLFETREIVHCVDPSINDWFKQANSIAVKDQERELLMFSTWSFYALRQARKLLDVRRDLELTQQAVLHAAHSLAHLEIIRAGNIYEDLVIYRAMELNPELFQKIYVDPLSKRKSLKTLHAAIDTIESYLREQYPLHLKPIISFLKKEDRIVPLSELSDHFAFSQVYPWHLESACEWLYREGILQKVSVPFKLTKRSQSEVEEPAYYFEN